MQCISSLDMIMVLYTKDGSYMMIDFYVVKLNKCIGFFSLKQGIYKLMEGPEGIYSHRPETCFVYNQGFLNTLLTPTPL